MIGIAEMMTKERKRLRNGQLRAPRSTTWPELDEHLGGGMRPGLYILTGEPKAGKSALAIYLMVQMAIDNREGSYGDAATFPYESLELSEGHILSRILSLTSYEVEELEAFSWTDYERLLAEDGAAEGGPVHLAARWLDGNLDKDVSEIDVTHRPGKRIGVLGIANDGSLYCCKDIEDYSNVRYRPLHDSDIEAIGQAVSWGDWGEEVFDNPYSEETPLVVIDYLQLVGVAELGEEADVYRRTNKVVGYLKNAECPVLAISEQNRAALRSTSKDGGRYGASGSGRIEYSALAVMRLELVRDEGEAGRVVALHVDLSRYGTPTGDSPIYLRYLPQYNVFAPLNA